MKKVTTAAELEALSSKLSQRHPPNRTCIVIPSGTCCRACGSAAVSEAIRRELEKHGLSDKVDVRETGCHGFCQMEPFVVIYPKGIVYQQLEPEDAAEIVERTIIKGDIVDRLCYVDKRTEERIIYEKDIPFYKKQKRNLMGNNAFIDPTSIEDYIALGGYQALFKVIEEKSPEEVIEEIKHSQLRGRGGGGFPTGKKWELARAVKSSTKYIVCNADEGDPGAYMDRSLLEGNPHALIEGMLIGAYAIGSQKGFIYVRKEYPLAVKHIRLAIQQAQEYGFLGEKIGSNGFGFEIEVEMGAGAFVCGEETALIASIEGKKGEPHQRPPYPVARGLWNQSTTINNVETWANVPQIILRGAEWFASTGTGSSKGTKIFSLVGKINNTGLVEVPMGISLREIIYDIGGGIPGDKRFKAVQTGGPSGGCIPAQLLDLPIDYESLKEAGSMMGSGGMVVMDEDNCMVDVARYFLNFLKDESCGKCFSCREGIRRMIEIITRLTDGVASMHDIDFLEQLGQTVKNASMCGLGQTAANSVISTLKHFRKEYELHARNKRCQAAVCQKIISSPCQHTCPIGTDVPAYVALIGRGEFGRAAEVIRHGNPLPNVCARVCARPCEHKCRSGEFGEPIAIRNLKRVAMDHELRFGVSSPPPREREYKETVGIVGSGPAGLAAAFYLAQAGYGVTVYESQPVIGGMLGIAIPDYRLPKDILQIDLDYIEKTGVKFVPNTAIGSDLSWEELRSRHDAIFIAAGAHKNLDLNIPGEEAEGVYDVIRFLREVKYGQREKIGDIVGVVGGGDAAIDAARAAYRLGCKKVIILYRRTRAEMPADDEEIEEALKEGMAMPADVEEIEEAIREGIEIQFLVAPKRALVKNGGIHAVECIRMELGEVDQSGRPKPVPIPGSEFTVELDTLIAAIGQKPDLGFIPEDSGIQISDWGTIVADPDTLQTGDSAVFAGGDVLTGPSIVVEVMGAGKVAAESIHQYLRGEPVRRSYSVTRPSFTIEPMEFDPEEIPESRVEVPRVPVAARIGNFDEVELCLEDEPAINECKRCLRCDLEAVIETGQHDQS
ncbi:MAG TPA: FAD-dependent oxidoreductase [Acidobacteriota bacterium]|nr:FAD-dependent oxidoreductase [Acidobacteriota bacterium]